MAWPAGIAQFQGLPTAPKTRDYGDNDGLWSGGAPWGVAASSGVDINQATALTATTVLACISMLCEDFAKCQPSLYRLAPDGERLPALDHELSTLIDQPNDWQSGFDFRSMLMFSFLLRGNSYAVKVRNARGRVCKLVPVNADWVALWEAPDGELFYRVTPNGLHMQAELRGQPFLIPFEDMFHVRDLSMNGLTGLSRIVAAKESIGLGIAYERQAGQWMGNGAAVSGVLTTDGKLTPEAAQRMAKDWREKKGGLQNSGAIVVLEQGLKYQQIAMTAQAAEFINSRKFQITDIARIWRIPGHMIGDLERVAGNSIEQLQASYINLTMTGHTSRWNAAYRFSFGLVEQGIYVDHDLSILTKADLAAQLNNGRVAIAGGVMTQNEVRLSLGLKPLPGGDTLLSPLNMGQAGSHATGVAPPGAGRPEQGAAEEQSPAARARTFNPDQPRAPNGEFSGIALTGHNGDGELKLLGIYASKDTHDAVKHALKQIGVDSADAHLVTHQVALPEGASPGDTVHVALSEDLGAATHSVAIHAVSASKAEATAAAAEASQAAWKTHGSGEPYPGLKAANAHFQEGQDGPVFTVATKKVFRGARQ